MARTFTVSYDQTTKMVSGTLIVILLLVAAVLHNVIVLILALLLAVFGFAFSPRKYVIADGEIVVKRLIGSVHVPIEGALESRKTTTEDLAGAVRLFGSGGLFGYYGIFSTTKLGRCTWYMTSRKNSVVVISAGKTILYSPDDVDGFLAAIQAAAPNSVKRKA